jgi:hypothetical protein
VKLGDVAARLAAGETVEFRPSGHSLEPVVKHRELVRVEPVGDEPIEPGQIVLAKVNGRFCLHLVGAVSGDQFRIENKRGRVNGWVGRRQIYGRLCRSRE